MTKHQEVYGDWEVNYEQLLFEADAKPLGQGAQGYVLAAHYRDEPVAVKVSHKPSNKSKFIAPFGREINNMVIAGFHPNIVCLVGVCCHPLLGQLLVIERCQQTLKTWLDLARRKEFARNPKLRIKILLDIAKGMAYLHSRGLLHCDLTSSNILVIFILELLTQLLKA